MSHRSGVSCLVVGGMCMYRRSSVPFDGVDVILTSGIYLRFNRCHINLFYIYLQFMTVSNIQVVR